MPPSRGLPALAKSGWSASFVTQCRARSWRESTRSFSVAIATRPRIPRSSLACVPIACQQHISMRNASWFSRSQPEPQPQTASPTAFVPDDAPASASPSATLHPPPEPPLAGTSDAASSLPEQPAYTNDFIGFLEKDYGIDFGWGTSSLVKYLFEHIHVYSGLPFAASIVLTGAVIRFAMIFAQRESVETSTRMSAMMPITKPLMARSTAAKLAGDSQESQKIRVELGRIYNESGIKIWKLGLGLLHIPLGFGCWRTFRNMADIPVAGLTTGGLGWFKDLTVADPFMVLPISTAAVQYFSTKWAAQNATAMSEQQQQFQRIAINGLPFLTVIFISFAPAAVQLHFFTTSVFALLTNFAFSSPTVRGWLRMHKKPPPEAPTESSYKGTINVAGKSSPTSAAGGARHGTQTAASPTPMGKSGILSGVAALRTNVMNGLKSVLPDASARKAQMQARGEKTKARDYEQRRQREIQEERVSRERSRR